MTDVYHTYVQMCAYFKYTNMSSIASQCKVYELLLHPQHKIKCTKYTDNFDLEFSWLTITVKCSQVAHITLIIRGVARLDLMVGQNTIA